MTTSDRVEFAPGWGQSESVWQPQRAAFWLLVALGVWAMVQTSGWVQQGFDFARDSALEVPNPGVTPGSLGIW